MDWNKPNSFILKQTILKCCICEKEYKGIYSLKNHILTIKNDKHIMFKSQKNYWSIQLEILGNNNKNIIHLLQRKVILLIKVNTDAQKKFIKKENNSIYYKRRKQFLRLWGTMNRVYYFADIQNNRSYLQRWMNVFIKRKNKKH